MLACGEVCLAEMTIVLGFGLGGSVLSVKGVCIGRSQLVLLPCVMCGFLFALVKFGCLCDFGWAARGL